MNDTFLVFKGFIKDLAHQNIKHWNTLEISNQDYLKYLNEWFIFLLSVMDFYQPSKNYIE